MKSKKMLKICCAASAVLLAAAILLIGGFVYILASDGESDVSPAEKSEDIDINETEKERLLNQKEDMVTLAAEVSEYRENELVFSFSMDDYIESYNGYYWREHEKRYILPVVFDNWQMQTLENGIHSPYNTVLYDYSADRKMLSLPLISFYVPPENDSVQEIAVIFDWHSYSRELHEQYEELCYYSVKTVLPELTEEQIVKLCSKINEAGYDHAFSMDEWYGSGSVPYELFYKGNIGVYSHFAIGSRQRLCIIPVTEQTLDEFARRGVVINEIDTCVPAADADSVESGLEKRLPASDEEKKDTEEKMRKAAGG